jgi:hypothetical protein
MKLLVILCIEEHEKQVRRLLRDEKVPVYSEIKIHGYSNEHHDADITNWFAHDEVERFSKLFFSIQSNESVKKVMDSVRNYNAEHEGMKNYPLHAYQLNVEDAV